MFKKSGPGVLIAAAFIGPGTVTTCLRSGIYDGYTLLWALLLSVFATVILQEMAGRLGLISGKGLPELIRSEIRPKFISHLILGIIFSAIVLGNAAYEAGNLAGASLGLEALFGSHYAFFFPILSGGIAIALLWKGSFRLLARIFTFLVLIMSLSFAITVFILNPDWALVLKGIFVPKVSSDSLLNVMALIGTTVVPYNLFLYSSLVKEKWNTPSELPNMRSDIIISVLIGGLISMAILITAAASELSTLNSVMDLASSLEPIYGPLARFGIGIGLFAAGITSAITAPMAAAYVAQQCFGWKTNSLDWRFRIVWIFIVLVGLGSHLLKFQPLEVIHFAQIANALLLPIIAIFLWWALQSNRIMGFYRNRKIYNLLVIVVLILVGGLAVRTFISIWGL